MPHVSSKQLDSVLSEKLFTKLLVVFGQAQNKNSLSKVINELLTPTEKTMLAKRLAIILMLKSHTPQHKIADILKVSPSTIARISLDAEIGEYDSILKISSREEADIEKLVWNILTVGGMMPPRAGKKYWTKDLKWRA